MLLTDLVNSLSAKQLAQSPVECRLTTRLFDYWKELRGKYAFPSREHIRFEDVPELSEYGFTLSVDEDGSDPTFHFVGSALKEHIGGDLGEKLAFGSSENTLFSLSLRLATHRYVEVLQRRAPVGFESELADQGGTNFLFRVIMLPFSDDDNKIDFILGAITYKEKLSETTSDAPAEDADTTGSRRQPSAVQEVGRSVTTDDDGGGDLATSVESALADSLRECRGLASIVQASESKSRAALYETLERAYRFHFETLADVAGYEALCTASGIKPRPRAHFTALIKLIFGKDHDKTRVSEYAACLSHAKRSGRQPGTLRALVEATDGGIKGCVKAERAARRSERGQSYDKLENSKSLLRELNPLTQFIDPSGATEEFVLLLARRQPERADTLHVICVLDEKPAVVETAVRRATKALPTRPKADDRS